MSQYKPEFNQNILKRELERDKIKYIHYQTFGVPSLMRDAVIAGYDSECFQKWYRLHVSKIHQDEFNQFLQELKENNRSILLCSEEYSKPKGSQKHFCHHLSRSYY